CLVCSLTLAVFGDLLCRLFLLFFFQAEDGIRDRNVTGVQTCALPISSSSSRSVLVTGRLLEGEDVVDVLVHEGGTDLLRAERVRSEERRVGKECRCRWAADQEKERGHMRDRSSSMQESCAGDSRRTSV